MSDIVVNAWHLQRDRSSGETRGVLFPLAAAALTITIVVSIGAMVTDGRSGLVPPAAQPGVPEGPPLAKWIDIVKPVQIYSLPAPELANAALLYKARRLSSGNGREDILTFGRLAGDRPSLRLRIYRGDKADLDRVRAVDPMDRVSPAFARNPPAAFVETRFGRFETSDVRVRDASAPVGPCASFRIDVDRPGLSISGIACGGRDKPVARNGLACLLDRLDLNSAGDDRDLGDFFAASELRHNGVCAGMRLAPDGAHAAWLDDKPATAPDRLRRR